MKKFFAILLALAMTFALSATALADETNPTGTITIANPQADKEYKAYRIFDAVPVPNSDPAQFSYTVTDPWYTALKDYDGGGITFTEAPGQPGTYVVKITDAFDAAAYAVYVNAHIPEGAEPAASGGPATNLDEPLVLQPKDLPYGYYFVTTGPGTVCSLDTNYTDVTIYDKNETPPFEKEVDDDKPEVGQTLNFTITGEVPPTTGYSEYEYHVYDNMTNLDYKEGSLQIKVGETVIYPVPENADYSAWLTVKENEGGTTEHAVTNGFDIKIDMIKAKTALPEVFKNFEEIVITYDALVTEAAIVNDTAKNEAHLEYPSDPTSEETSDVPQEVIVHVYDIEVQKKIKDTETPLAGAEFVLYKVVHHDEVPDDPTTEDENEFVAAYDETLYYKWNEPDSDHQNHNWVSWETDIANATHKTTGADGKVRFEGLEEGTYYLLETESPDGYNLLTDPVEVVVGPTTSEGETTYVDIPVPVENSTGSELPATGGIGTTIFYIVGALLMVGAAVLLIVRKKMSVME